MGEYLSVADCLRQNGYRHYCNGMKYLERQMFKHARGSFAKAQRNYDRAEYLDLTKQCLDLINNSMDMLANNVANAFMVK